MNATFLTVGSIKAFYSVLRWLSCCTNVPRHWHYKLEMIQQLNLSGRLSVLHQSQDAHVWRSVGGQLACLGIAHLKADWLSQVTVVCSLTADRSLRCRFYWPKADFMEAGSTSQLKYNWINEKRTLPYYTTMEAAKASGWYPMLKDQTGTNVFIIIFK